MTVTEPQPDRPALSDAWLIHALSDAGVVDEARIAEVVRDGEPALWPALVRRGWATDGEIIHILSETYRVPAADLAGADPRAATLVPENLARKHQVVPLSATDRRIRVATADPRNLDVEQTLAFITDRSVQFELAPPLAISDFLDQLYRPERKIEQLLAEFGPSDVMTLEGTGGAVGAGAGEPTLEAPIAKLVDSMIADGVRRGASDIHADPIEGALVVRYRVDGVLHELMRLPESAGASLVRRVKVWARLDVTDPLRPHDGRATLRVDGKKVDLRVATSPVARRGEKVVIRILDKSNLRTRIEDIGLSPGERAQVEPLLGVREGLVVVTGPTGSGKTTTLYAAINQLRTGQVNIITVEDPVEYDINGVSQIQVNEAQGLSFAKTLRSVLRQDPDIVLVGEIRDLETAETAVQAGLTGHLVLSTLHTNDAPSSVMRLRDLGLEPFKVAGVLKGVVAQRLVRRLCEACAQPMDFDALPADAQPPAGATAVLRAAVGCPSCHGTGYRGRLAVVEIMTVDAGVALAIDRDLPFQDIAAAARRAGMRTLWQSGLDRVWRGLTTVEELVRVLGERVQEDGSTIPDRPSVLLVPEQVRQAVAAVPPAPAAEGVTRILVADDDHQMRRLIRTVLEREGFQVVEAEDGLDALERVEGDAFDLLVLDVDMPRLDGFSVLEELRERQLAVVPPIVMLTARQDDAESRALELGAQDFLNKPLQPRSLVARVRAVLRRQRL